MARLGRAKRRAEFERRESWDSLGFVRATRATSVVDALGDPLIDRSADQLSDLFFDPHRLFLLELAEFFLLFPQRLLLTPQTFLEFTEPFLLAGEPLHFAAKLGELALVVRDGKPRLAVNFELGDLVADLTLAISKLGLLVAQLPLLIAQLSLSSRLQLPMPSRASNKF